ncbi:hypothetical protein T492DRAFT_835585 [Pavlovales sp. CCMP2436]|nr:hypothetical protein T492DRAFT_835585 [Pavlovales sp. CCMP2436]
MIINDRYGIRRAPPNLVTFGLNFAGLVKMVSLTCVRVRAGASMGELTRIVNDQGGGNYALFDRAQFDPLSVGACVRTAAIGWAKEAWFIESVRAIEVMERGSGKVIEVRKGDAKFLDCCFDAKHVILEIEIALTINQKVRVQYKTFKPPTGDAAFDTQTGPDLAEWEQADFKLMWYPKQIVSKTAVKVITDAFPYLQEAFDE